jgi:hypothetical protein
MTITNDNNPYKIPTSELTTPEMPTSNKPVIMATLGLIFWLIPLIGLPISIIGLVITIKRRAAAPKKYVVSYVLLIVALCLSVMNMGIGAYMGMIGQNKLVNKILGQ